MKKKQSPISLEEAMKLAKNAAKMNLECFIDDDSHEILDRHFIEADNCWMFFRSKEIIVPPEGELRGSWAYAVSKLGEIREVPDLSCDDIKLKAYLWKMSDYFGGNKQ